MRRIEKIGILTALTAVILFTGTMKLWAQFAGGSGTENDPWLVETAEQLYSVVRYYSGNEHSDKHYLQISDIYLSDFLWDEEENSYINNGRGWTPGYRHFMGTYNGDGHIIDGLHINNPNVISVGFFPSVREAVIENLRLTNVNITGGSSVGSLAGESRDSKILNCYSAGTVQGDRRVGGLVGTTNTTLIEKSFSTGLVRALTEVPHDDPFALPQSIGGLVGKNRASSTLENCYTVSIVTGSTGVGGIVGWNNTNATIRNCYSAGMVEGPSIGGLVGRSTDATTSTSYWNIDTSGIDYSQGGTGLTTEEMVRQVNFAGFDFHSVWRIDENRTYPRLHWQEEADSHNIPTPHGLYAEVDVEAREVELTWQMSVGTPDRYRIYCNNVIVTEVDHPTRNYIDENIPFAYKLRYHITAVFVDDQNQETETLAAKPVKVFVPVDFEGGAGTEASPYRISTAKQLSMANQFLESHYIMIEDIDLAVEPWTQRGGWHPIGSTLNGAFRGSFDGNGHVIRGLFIDNPTGHKQGLFGYTKEAVINDLKLVNVDINGGYSVGALIGKCVDTTIENIYISGVIKGSSITGGLAGVTSHAVLRNCYVNGTVEGSQYVGGLVAECGSTNITSSHVAGKVTGSSIVGGLIGRKTNVRVNSGILKNSSNSSDVIGIHSQIGGLVGHLLGHSNGDARIINCYNSGNIQGNNVVGGCIGITYFDVDATNIFNTGTITGNSQVGGLAGVLRRARLNNSFNAGGVSGTENVGGLIGVRQQSGVNRCYWDIEMSGQFLSDGGYGRNTEEMTYPYAENSFRGWDFENEWRGDEDYIVNNGYPYLYWQKPPVPEIAFNPYPEDKSTGIPIELEYLSWSWEYNYAYPLIKPVGFKVYFGTTDDFDDFELYSWIPYLENQTNYYCKDILPEKLDFETVYYWKVVPTTVEPDRKVNDRDRTTRREKNIKQRTAELSVGRVGGDAINAPVWQFTTVEKEVSVEDDFPEYVTMLQRNYPNPFNPNTVIEFSVKEETDVKITIYNLKGQRVKKLQEGVVKAGEHRVYFDGTDDRGRSLSSGVYLYRMITNDYDRTNRMILVK